MFITSFSTLTVSMASVIALILFTLFCLIFPDNAALSSDGDGKALIAVDVNDDGDEGSVESANGLDTIDTVFKASREWATIKPGQGVPRGIHVRLNLQSGLNEGKLLDEDDSDETHHLDFTDDEKLNSQIFTRTELKEAVKNFRADMDDVKDPEVIAKAKSKKWRSYEELKEQLLAENTLIKSDLEILREKLDLFHNPHTDDHDKKLILEDFEYHLHQYDNAVNFVDMGGLEVVGMALNHSDVEFRGLGSLVLMSAAQSNIKVQSAILDSGLLPLLMRTCSVESDNRAKKRHFSAISAILRQYPAAQKKFMDFGGPEVIQLIFTNPSVDLELKIRAVTFISDLISESLLLGSGDVSTAIDSEFERAQNAIEIAKREQYKQVGLIDKIIQRGWCEQIERLLPVTYPHLDSTEKTLHALGLIMKPCAGSFVNLKDHLINLREEFVRQTVGSDKKSVGGVETEGDAEWIRELLTLTDSVLNGYYVTVKQEL